MASFSKALAATALSAVLVGCGGGGDSETIKIGDSETIITIPEAAKTASLKLDIARDRLSETSPTAEQIKDVEDAISELDTAIEDLPPSNEKEMYQEQIQDAQKELIDAYEKIGDKSEADRKREEAARKEAEAEAARKEAEAEAAKKKAQQEREEAAAKRKRELAAPTFSAMDTTPGTNSIRNPEQITHTNKITIAGVTFDENIRGTGWQYQKYSTDSVAGSTPGISTSEKIDVHMYSYVGEPVPGNIFASDYDSGGAILTGYQYMLSGDTSFTRNSEKNRYIEFGSNGNPASPDPKYVKASEFTQKLGTSATNYPFATNTTRPNKDNTITAPVDIFKTSGSYHGVSGYYECTSACTVTTQEANGKFVGYILNGGNWVFAPDNSKTKVSATPDNVYASYGWWIETDTLSPKSIGVFIGQKGTPWVSNVVADVTGKATYTGKAAGQFAVIGEKDVTPDAGSFTATATLRADFDSEKLSGTISNFRGPKNGSSWIITLPENDIQNSVAAPGGHNVNVVGPKTIWSVDGRTFENINTPPNQGDWEAKFADKDPLSSTPKVVVGAFSAIYDSPKAKMVGAFGATTND